MTYNKIRTPFVYCLTGETDEDELVQISKAGFKTIFSTLDNEALEKIMSDAELKA